MIKKILCLLMCLLLVFSCIVSCGGNSTGKNNNHTSKNSEKYTQKESSSVNKKTDSTVKATTAKTAIDPFANIEYTVGGISPYCVVNINTSNCSEAVQKYVSYKLDKERYANGDTVKITATLDWMGSSSYTLSKTESTYKIEKMPEYITSLSGVNTSKIEAELEDWMVAHTAQAIGRYSIFDTNMGQIESVSIVKKESKYFSSLKLNKIEENHKIVNMLSFVYSADVIKYGNVKATAYGVVSAVNIVKYPDGTIKWGERNPDAMDFTVEGDTKSMENCVTTIIMRNNNNYNISKVG